MRKPDISSWFSVLRIAGILVLLLMMASGEAASQASSELVALHLAKDIRLDAAHPAAEWRKTAPISFFSDWQGETPDRALPTEVRALWTRQTLYLRFECRYRELYVFADADPNGRRDHLWDRDVVEAFLQPDPTQPRFYKEFEVSPNGFWIDLDISPAGGEDLKSGLQRSVWLDEKSHIWVAELAIPMKSLIRNFDPKVVWRANFYRVEGSKEPRTYLAWQPTHTPQPNFHVPAAFGKLRFAAH